MKRENKMAAVFSVLHAKALGILDQLFAKTYEDAVRINFPSCHSLNKGLATLTMKKPPVNSLNLTTLNQISQCVKEMENTSGCKGFVLTSEVPKIFSAGLDITDLRHPDRDELRTFWHALQEVWLTLFGTKLASVAAITGHAAAGGCMIALCCDYRIMVGGRVSIGLNESLLGFPAPPWLTNTMEFTVGSRNTERALCLGTMFNTEQALQQGVVDEMATTPEETLEKAKEQLRKLAAIPEHARQATKRSMRQSLLKKFHACREEDLNYYVNFISSDEVQKTIDSYFEALKKRKG